MMASPAGSKRVVLSVIGPHSGCGKSCFVVHVLRRIPGLGCLKISPPRDRFEGVVGGGRADVVRPDAANGRGYCIEEASCLERSGKDTASYIAAGAVQVARLRPETQGLAAGLRAALERFPPGCPVVLESSRAVALLDPVAVILVIRPPIREMKPGTRAVLSRVTDLLINAPCRDCDPSGGEDAERLVAEFPLLRPRYTWRADLICQAPPDKMLERLRAVLSAGLGHDALP